MRVRQVVSARFCFVMYVCDFTCAVRARFCLWCVRAIFLCVVLCTCVRDFIYVVCLRFCLCCVCEILLCVVSEILLVLYVWDSVASCCVSAQFCLTLLILCVCDILLVVCVWNFVCDVRARFCLWCVCVREMLFVMWERDFSYAVRTRFHLWCVCAALFVMSVWDVTYVVCARVYSCCDEILIDIIDHERIHLMKILFVCLIYDLGC